MEPGRPTKVAITDVIAADPAPERAILGDVAALEALAARCEQDFEDRIEAAGALIVHYRVPLSARTIARLERRRAIARTGAGSDNIDIEAARSIPVVSVPDHGVEEVPTRPSD